jgi:hypothetical protein
LAPAEVGVPMRPGVSVKVSEAGPRDALKDNA